MSLTQIYHYLLCQQENSTELCCWKKTYIFTFKKRMRKQQTEQPESLSFKNGKIAAKTSLS
jgi:hypothetical protein